VSRPFPTHHPRPQARLRRVAAAVTAACAVAFGSGSTAAFEFNTGNPDLTVRWDNTPRLNLGWRVEQRDDLIGNNQLYDEGTYSFDRGDLVAGRIDWFTELDVVFQKRFGGRVSAQLWYDAAYGTYGRSNPRRTCTAAPTPSSSMPSCLAASTLATRR
jgi:Protein of unknown function (DUF1302)